MLVKGATESWEWESPHLKEWKVRVKIRVPNSTFVKEKKNYRHDHSFEDKVTWNLRMRKSPFKGVKSKGQNSGSKFHICKGIKINNRHDHSFEDRVPIFKYVT